MGEVGGGVVAKVTADLSVSRLSLRSIEKARPGTAHQAFGIEYDDHAGSSSSPKSRYPEYPTNAPMILRGKIKTPMATFTDGKRIWESKKID